MLDRDRARALTDRERLTVGALLLFAVAGTLGGFLLSLAGGFIALALCALVIAVLLGWQS